jgi:hypothetical protein
LAETAFAEVQNELRQEVNYFAAQNCALEKSNEDLKLKAFFLQETEQRLKDITKDQNLNVKSLVNLVGENQIILDEKKKLVLKDIITDLMDTVLKCERDGSGDFSDKEVKRLLRFMKGLPAVRVNEELLKKALDRDRSILALMKLVHDIGLAGEQEGDHIFVIDMDDEKLQHAVMERV